MRALFVSHASPAAQLAQRAMSPLIGKVMRRQMDINPASAEIARAKSMAAMERLASEVRPSGYLRRSFHGRRSYGSGPAFTAGQTAGVSLQSRRAASGALRENQGISLDPSRVPMDAADLSAASRRVGRSRGDTRVSLGARWMAAGPRQSSGISSTGHRGKGGRKGAPDRTANRRRRNAAQTRSAILEAAERRLLAGGPDAIRLQEIAADAGISHPAILHHFGSREGLPEAMVLRGIARFQAQFLEGWPSAREPDIEGVLERFYEVASHRGMARMLAWLILTGESQRTMKPGLLEPAAERMHAGRVRRAHQEGRRPPELEESLFAATELLFSCSAIRCSARASAAQSASAEAPTAPAVSAAG